MRRAARVGPGLAHLQPRPGRSPRRRWHASRRLLAEQGRTRAEITVTVCPYFKPLDASITEQYAEAGADAVSALLFAMSADDVPAAFEALEPCIERARAC